MRRGNTINVRYPIDDPPATVDFHAGQLGITMCAGGPWTLLADPAGSLVEPFQPAS